LHIFDATNEMYLSEIVIFPFISLMFNIVYDKKSALHYSTDNIIYNTTQTCNEVIL